LTKKSDTLTKPCGHRSQAQDGGMVNNFVEKANFIWSVADLIRDTFKNI
jgi:hypothetical protein